MKVYPAWRGVGQLNCKDGANTGCMVAPSTALTQRFSSTRRIKPTVSTQNIRHGILLPIVQASPTKRPVLSCPPGLYTAFSLMTIISDEHSTLDP